MRHTPQPAMRDAATAAKALAVAAAATVAAVALTLTAAGPALAATAVPFQAPATAASAKVKYYVVPPSSHGSVPTLYSIAAATLGNGSLFMEIFNLNKGRLQPNGQRLEDPHSVEPGWILLLPPDASGPGVHFGPLPTAAKATAQVVHRHPHRSQATATARAAAAGAGYGSGTLVETVIGGALLVFAAAGLGLVVRRRRRTGGGTRSGSGRRAGSRSRRPGPRSPEPAEAIPDHPGGDWIAAWPRTPVAMPSALAVLLLAAVVPASPTPTIRAGQRATQDGRPRPLTATAGAPPNTAGAPPATVRTGPIPTTRAGPRTARAACSPPTTRAGPPATWARRSALPPITAGPAARIARAGPIPTTRAGPRATSAARSPTTTTQAGRPPTPAAAGQARAGQQRARAGRHPEGGGRPATAGTAVRRSRPDGAPRPGSAPAGVPGATGTWPACPGPGRLLRPPWARRPRRRRAAALVGATGEDHRASPADLLRPGVRRRSPPGRAHRATRGEPGVGRARRHQRAPAHRTGHRTAGRGGVAERGSR